MLADLAGNDAQQVQRLGMVRLRRKNLPVQGFRLRQAPRFGR